VRVLSWVVFLAGCDHLLDLQPITVHHDASTRPQLLQHAFAHDGLVPMVTFKVQVPDVANTLVIVTVMLAGDQGTSPAIGSITCGGTALTQFEQIVFVPLQPTTRSEQWLLVAPPAGLDDVVVLLDAPGASVHASALVFGGVDQVNPIRNSNHTSGFDVASTLTVDSADSDLVESCIGHGQGLATVGGGQTVVFIDNVNTSTALNNHACSTASGAAPSVEMSWMDGSNIGDSFQEIAASLQPAL
jgi:hypothetical protein